MCTVSCAGRSSACRPPMTACSSMRLFVVAGSAPDSSTCLAIAPSAARATRIAAQPPGPGLPEQAPSVHSSIVPGTAETVGADADGAGAPVTAPVRRASLASCPAMRLPARSLPAVGRSVARLPAASRRSSHGRRRRAEDVDRVVPGSPSRCSAGPRACSPARLGIGANSPARS